MELQARQEMVIRVALVIVVSTLVLTASFFGVIAALSEEVTGLDDRMPFYLLAAAGMFVGTIILLEMYQADGKTIITSAVFTGITSFVLALFSVEGILFAYEHPERVIVNQLILYFLAAALVATGLGYWALRHWREFTEGPSNSL